jgi:hypothetical protein
MSIGTRRRKRCRKRRNTFRESSAVRHGPRIKSGVTGAERPRIRPALFRHSGPHSVIPAPIPSFRPPFRHSGLDPESMSIGTRRRKRCRKRRNTFRESSAVRRGPRIKSGVTGAERPRIRPALFRHSGPIPSFRPPFRHSGPHSVIPGLTRNPCPSERDGGSVAGSGRRPSGHFQPFDMDPGSSPG